MRVDVSVKETLYQNPLASAADMAGFDDVKISWDFWPLREPGLCTLFFAARGRNGDDLFDPVLDARNGLRSICSKIIFAMERNIVSMTRLWDARAMAVWKFAPSIDDHLSPLGGPESDVMTFAEPCSRAAVARPEPAPVTTATRSSIIASPPLARVWCWGLLRSMAAQGLRRLSGRGLSRHI